ncbi:hypothetical protein HK104_001634 [Borealophlyctis nickersoniae]|nr:hypothetical protein HK104_001634 [Borealophlyctis nickersoniae]
MELRKIGTRDGSQSVAGRTRSRRVLISDATPAPAAPPTTEVASDTEEATEAAPPRAQRVTRAKAKKPAAASRTGPGKPKRSVEPEVVAEGGGDEGGVSENEKPVRPKRQVKQRKEVQKTGKGVKKAATRQTVKRVWDGGKRNEDAKGENEGSDEGEGRARTRGGSPDNLNKAPPQDRRLHDVGHRQFPPPMHPQSKAYLPPIKGSKRPTTSQKGAKNFTFGTF